MNTKMIEELATTENYLVIRELVKLWPQIRYEHNKNLFKNAFDIIGTWENYDKTCGVDGDLFIANRQYNSKDFFRFAINFDDDGTNEHSNWFFGIIGPWSLRAKYPEILELETICKQVNLRDWSWGWKFQDFKLHRNDVIKSLTNGSDVKLIIQEMAKQFNSICSPAKEQVEKINSMISQENKQ
jgi:hypothetical protein